MAWQPKLGKITPEQGAGWSREAKDWAKKRARLKKEWNERPDFNVIEKTLFDGTVVTVKRWRQSKKIAEVLVKLLDGNSIVYRARYNQGRASWSKTAGGEPPDPYQVTADPTDSGIYKSQPEGDKD
ncbi:MAG: hypothetical protein AB1721_00220 [Patescibacteria group bacterium]